MTGKAMVTAMANIRRCLPYGAQIRKEQLSRHAPKPQVSSRVRTAYLAIVTAMAITTATGTRCVPYAAPKQQVGASGKAAPWPPYT